MDLGLKGKSVLVTGGSKGIGLACARAIALAHTAAEAETSPSNSTRSLTRSRFAFRTNAHQLRGPSRL